MQAVSTQKFVRVSPRKLRLVADVARKMRPTEVVETLPFSAKHAADPLVKVVKSAIANAVVLGANPESLVFRELQVNEGPRLKRFRAVSRGRAHGYVKQMSHIRVVVETEEKPVEKPEVKMETKVAVSKETQKVIEKTAKKDAEKNLRAKK